MTSPLNGQTVIVIGGSSGIGAAVAKAAAARGAQVVLAGRRLSSSRDNGLRSEPVDVTDTESLRRLFETVGRFDHLVYTSGPSVHAKALIDTDLDEAQDNFNVKLWGGLAGNPAGAAVPRRARQHQPDLRAIGAQIGVGAVHQSRYQRRH